MKTEIVNINTLDIHEMAKMTPSHTRESYNSLVKSLSEEGQQEPVVVYRNKIIDGRHRFKALNQLGENEILIRRLANNSTLSDIVSLVRTAETRRHQTTSQLAIYAWKQANIIRTSGEKITNSEAAEKFGTTVKEIGRVTKLIGSKTGQFNRSDIIDILFDGKKLDIGNQNRPFLTNSLQTIINHLSSIKAGLEEDITGIVDIEELTESEEVYINQVINSVRKESSRVAKELSSRLYAMSKE